MTVARDALLHTVLRDGETLIWSEMVHPARIRRQQLKDVAGSVLFHVSGFFACMLVAAQLIPAIGIYLQREEIIRLWGSFIVLVLIAPISMALIYSLFTRLRYPRDAIDRFPIAYGITNQRLFALGTDGNIHSSLEADEILRVEGGTSKSEILVTGTEADKAFIMVMLTDKTAASKAIEKVILLKA